MLMPIVIKTFVDALKISLVSGSRRPILRIGIKLSSQSPNHRRQYFLVTNYRRES